MIYRLLKIIVSIGIRAYYREIRVMHKEHLAHKGPTIIIANHPNTLMDAWMVGYICKDPIYYMAKATFFNTKLKRWFLGGLGLIPINRATESKTKGVSNADSFENCYRLLERGKTLVIFPEGNSFNERQLRMLKSGTARIALEVLKRTNGEANLRVIPVGLVYSEPEKFRSSVLVNVGEPIDPTPYLEMFRQDSLKAARKLTEEFRASMEDLLVGAHSTEHEELVNTIIRALSDEYVKSSERGVQKNVSLIRNTFESLHRLQRKDPEMITEISELVYQINVRLDKLGIKSDFLDRKYKPRMFFRQMIFSTVFLVVGSPMYVYGVIHNYLQYKFTDLLLVRMVKELEYYAPIAVLMSLVIYPLTYWGFLELIDFFYPMTPWTRLFYYLSMPLFGLFAWFYHSYIGHISVKTNYMLLMMTEKETMEALKSDRQRLRELLEWK